MKKKKAQTIKKPRPINRSFEFGGSTVHTTPNLMLPNKLKKCSILGCLKSALPDWID